MADGAVVDDGGAAQAFDELRGELTLLRRAIERLTAERADDGHAPDYSETLGVIAANITATAQRVDMLVKSPALSLTPHEIGRQVLEVGVAGRSEDRRAIGAARQTIEEVATRLGRQLESHVMAEEQQRRVRHVGRTVGRNVGLIALVTGAALWAILAGPIARFMPASWLLPERMAARSLRMPMWEGGQRLMRAGDPQAFRWRAGRQPADDRQPRSVGGLPQTCGPREEGGSLCYQVGGERVAWGRALRRSLCWQP